LADSAGEKRRRFEAEVLPHLDAAYRFACWLSRTRNDAEDLVQEAFLRAFRGFDALRSTDAKAWLLAIIRNCHATAIQRQKQRRQVPLPEENDAFDAHALVATTPDPESVSMHSDDARLLDRVMSTLPEAHREVLALREIEELDYREIAAVLNVPIGTVMSRLARARAELKVRFLDEARGDPRAVR
jgi:RNA polymerase sigma factor (sigma-70 family)